MAKVLENSEMENQMIPSAEVLHQQDAALQAAMSEMEMNQNVEDETDDPYGIQSLEKSKQAVTNVIKDSSSAVPVARQLAKTDVENVQNEKSAVETVDALTLDNVNVKKTYSNVIAQLCSSLAGLVGKQSPFGKNLLELADDIEFRETGHGGIVKSNEDIKDVMVASADQVKYENMPMEHNSSAEIHQDAVDFVSSGKVEQWAAAHRFDNVVRDEEKRLAADNATMQADVDGKLWNPDLSADERQHAVDPLIQNMLDLKQFNDNAREAIDTKYADDPEAHKNAMRGLKKYMVVNVQDGFDRIYKTDVTEHAVTPEMKDQLNTLHFDGVTQNYEQFANSMTAEGKDVQYARDRDVRIDMYTVNNVDLADSLKSHTPNPGLDDIKADMSANARTLVDSDRFLELSDPKNQFFKVLDSQLSGMSRRMSMNMYGNLAGIDVTESDRHAEGQKYMHMMEGMHAFNDAARDTIETKYADDSEKLSQARQGLSNVMQHMVGSGMSQIYIADKTANILSDDMRTHLDDMHFEGMSMTYSDFEQIRDEDRTRVLNQKNAAVENTSAFEQAYESAIDKYQAVSEEAAVDAKGVNSMGRGVSRAAEAEGRFGHIIKLDEQENVLNIGLGE